MNRVPLIYALHSGNLYGTERMALATAEGLRDHFDPLILSPPGPLQTEAERMGMEARSFSSVKEFARLIRPRFAQSSLLAMIATGIAHSFCAMAVNAFYRRRLTHLHVVHGGTDERLSYGRKKWLNRSSAVLVAVSEFVKQRLVANGTSEQKVQIIENFLPERQLSQCARRDPFRGPPAGRALVISRVDPIKRVDLLLDALGREPALAKLQVRVLGTGWDLEKLRSRASYAHANVTFAGFVTDIDRELANADLLIHLCPAEPFGLAILEAMAAHVPVLVPDQGGAGSLVEDGVTGFRFRANDAAFLAKRLLDFFQVDASGLNLIAARARKLLDTRFSARGRIHDYRVLLEQGLA